LILANFIDIYGDFIIQTIAVLIGAIAIYITIKRGKIEAPDIKEPLKNLSSAKSVQEIAASQLNILNEYYNNVLSQSQRSFFFALLAAGIGLLFIIAAASFVLLNQLEQLALITGLGAALSAFVSGVNFYLYKESSSQLWDFHSRLEMTQRSLLADGLCNTIVDANKKDETRCALINTIAKINTGTNRSPTITE
jgi:hypothetical protein